MADDPIRVVGMDLDFLTDFAPEYAALPDGVVLHWLPDGTVERIEPDPS